MTPTIIRGPDAVHRELEADIFLCPAPDFLSLIFTILFRPFTNGEAMHHNTSIPFLKTDIPKIRWLILPVAGELAEKIFTSLDKIPSMKYYVLPLIGIMIFALLLAGCTQSSGTRPVASVVTATTIPTPEPTIPVQTPAITAPPKQVVTIVHQVSLTKDIKDSELLFTLQVPEEWTVSTHRLVNPADSEGLVYQTDIVRDNVFYIHTYAISRSQDQAYRDQFRKWSSSPVTETTITINGITYDRFESIADGKTNVAYVARKSSANERGYASVLVFSADNNNRFEKDDFEKIVASFKYFGAGSASAMPGDEIPRTSG